MKNIKGTEEKTLVPKKVFLLLVGISLLFLTFYLFALWFASGFDPYFMQVDFCLDDGGKWNSAAHVCVYE